MPAVVPGHDSSWPGRARTRSGTGFASRFRWAWRSFTFGWTPGSPGRYVLCVRARDEAGNVQPDEPVWNVGGYANNAVQRVAVNVA